MLVLLLRFLSAAHKAWPVDVVSCTLDTVECGIASRKLAFEDLDRNWLVATVKKFNYNCATLLLLPTSEAKEEGETMDPPSEFH